MREHLLQVIDDLRQAQAAELAPLPVATVGEVLDAVAVHLARLAAAGRLHPDGRAADAQPAALPSASLEALLASLRGDALRALLAEERDDPTVLDQFRPRRVGGWQRATGPQVIGHVLAGNTPLLSWPSFAAALLVKSASLAKLPSDDEGWPRLFHEALRAVHPGLACCLALMQWPGGTTELDALLCAESDAVVAYGSDAALAALRALTPLATPFHAYGHRLSLGLVLRGADKPAAAAGLARDVLLFDQQGCLSAALVVVEGDVAEAARFGACLAAALEQQAAAWGLGPRDPLAAARVRSRRDTALFAPNARVWGDPGLRWTVLLDPETTPEPAAGGCVVPLHPLSALERLPTLLAPLRAHLQGAALAAPPERRLEAAAALAAAGVNRICAPGALQAPPFSWHHDGRPVLAALVRWTDLEM